MDARADASGGELLGRRSRGPSRLRQLLVSSRWPRLWWLLIAAGLVYYPLGLLFLESFRLEGGRLGLANYVEMFNQPAMLRAALHSLWIASGTSLAVLAISLPMAYLVSRTDMPGRGFVRSVVVLTFAAPSFIAALGWVLLLGPRAGVLNTFLQNTFGFTEGPFNIFSPWGIIFVLTLFLYPLVFLNIVAALDNMDASLEQAAANLGAGRLRVLRRITLPLIMPALVAGVMLVFVSAFVIFGPVAILGGPVNFDTVPTLMLRLMRTPPPRIAMAAVFGVPVLLLLAVFVYIQKRLTGSRSFVVVSGKPSQRSVVRLGWSRWVGFAGCMGILVVSLVMPFGTLLVTGFRRSLGLPLGRDNFVLFRNYLRLFRLPEVSTAFWHSFLLAVGAVVASSAFALLAAWLVQRDRSMIRPLVQPTMLSPLAFPGALMGIALVIAFARPPFRLGGGLAIILLAYLLRSIPISFAYVRAGFRQLGPEMEEASRSLGASWTHTFRQITLPLLKGPLLSAGLLNFVLMFRELDTSIFLYSGTNQTVSVVLYNLATQSRFQLMGAFSIVVLAINVGVVIAARLLLGSRFGSQA